MWMSVRPPILKVYQRRSKLAHRGLNIHQLGEMVVMRDLDERFSEKVEGHVASGEKGNSGDG